MSNVKVWLDDLRDPKTYGHGDAVWCKNYAAFESFVHDNPTNITEIHFDNDLGETMEGYDAFVMVEGLLFIHKLPSLKRIYVHTSNPSASNKFMVAKEAIHKRFGVDMMKNNY